MKQENKPVLRSSENRHDEPFKFGRIAVKIQRDDVLDSVMAQMQAAALLFPEPEQEPEKHLTQQAEPEKDAYKS
jgi:hypothetical protein